MPNKGDLTPDVWKIQIPGLAISRKEHTVRANQSIFYMSLNSCVLFNLLCSFQIISVEESSSAHLQLMLISAEENRCPPKETFTTTELRLIEMGERNRLSDKGEEKQYPIVRPVIKIESQNR